MLKISLLVLTIIGISSTFTCQDPKVTDCYKAEKEKCWTHVKKLDDISQKSAEAMKNQDTAKGVEKLLLNGKEWKDTWTVTKEGDFIYFSANKQKQAGLMTQVAYIQGVLSSEAALGDFTAGQALLNFNTELGFFTMTCLAHPVHEESQIERYFLQMK